jgi:adenosine kinase
LDIALTGSIATDYLMTFPGRFADHIVADQIEHLSVSFLVDELEVRRGGVAANIGYGMGQLGESPVLLGSVGQDFATEYEPLLQRHGVDTRFVRVSETKHTARFLCTTDETECQIASFYAGAMAEADEIEIAAVAEQLGGLDYVVVSPNDPAAMVRHTRDAHSAGLPVVADPSQQVPRLDGEQLATLIDGAALFMCNDYERSLCEQKTGWSGDEILARVGMRVTTYGSKGILIERKGGPAVEVAAIPPDPSVTVEPTGAGDAFRAGFLTGLSWGVSYEQCAQIGAVVATACLESPGPQEYAADRDWLASRVSEAYGEEAAAELKSRMG